MATPEADIAAQLIERLLCDPSFRADFRRDPASACRAAGLDELADEMSLGAGKAMMTLDVRESKSSLAGVMMAAAMEGVGVYQFGENVLPHIDDVPGEVGDVLSRVNLPASGCPTSASRARSPARPHGRAPARPRERRRRGRGDAAPRRAHLPRLRLRRRRRPRRRRGGRQGGGRGREGGRRGEGGSGQAGPRPRRRRPRSPRPSPRRPSRPRRSRRPSPRSPRRPRTSPTPATCPDSGVRPGPRSKGGGEARAAGRPSRRPAPPHPRQPAPGAAAPVARRARAGRAAATPRPRRCLNNENLVLDADAQKDIATGRSTRGWWLCSTSSPRSTRSSSR